jgi:hypothetical protein
MIPALRAETAVSESCADGPCSREFYQIADLEPDVAPPLASTYQYRGAVQAALVDEGRELPLKQCQRTDAPDREAGDRFRMSVTCHSKLLRPKGCREDLEVDFRVRRHHHQVRPGARWIFLDHKRLIDDLRLRPRRFCDSPSRADRAGEGHHLMGNPPLLEHSDGKRLP